MTVERSASVLMRRQRSPNKTKIRTITATSTKDTVSKSHDSREAYHPITDMDDVINDITNIKRPNRALTATCIAVDLVLFAAADAEGSALIGTNLLTMDNRNMLTATEAPITIGSKTNHGVFELNASAPSRPQ